MSFIEQLFGLSPDRGNGSTESIYFMVLGIIVFACLRQRSILALLRRVLGR
jgi:hypothetical protein